MTTKLQQYLDFLRNKVQLQSGGGLTPYNLHSSLFPHQKDIVRWALQRGKALIAAKFGMGKCHGIGTKILMADGSIKNVEDIQVGDQLMGDDGTPRNVLSLARGREQMYRITLKNGDSYTCNESHVLSLRISNKYGPYQQGDIVNMPLRDYLQFPHFAKLNVFKHYKVGIEFDEQSVPFDPYLYGTWLGDGSSRELTWTINDRDTEITERILEFAGEKDLHVREVTGQGCTQYALSRKVRGNAPHCDAFYLIKDSVRTGEKRIDERYLKNDRTIQLMTLAGLLDTDGYLTDKCYEIATKWIGLRDDILFLCRSLGFSVTHREKIVNGVTYYRIWISGDTHLIPCITRKKAEKRLQIKNPLVYGFSVEPLGEGDYYGFELDGNHLYLLGDFTVTHNTRIQIELMRQVHMQTGRKVLVICPLGVKHQFIHEDGPAMDVKFAYIGTDEQGLNADTPYLITNYERVRDGQISEGFLQSEIAGVTLDEGAILGNLGTKTQQEFSRILSAIPYRWVATATPAPNDYRQLIYFADFLDAMDAGQSLTRWFGRNPDKAGDLQLMPHMEREFWLWIASWALFVDTPSDLGYSDEGYVMPELNIVFHRLTADHTKAWDLADQFGQHFLFADTSAGVQQAMKEKHNSLSDRISRTLEIVLQYSCSQISNDKKGDSNGVTQRVQQEVLSGASGDGETAQTGLVLSEQGEDRQGEAQGLYEGVSEDIQEAAKDTGTERGNKSKKAGTVRHRSGASGKNKAECADEAQSSVETFVSSENRIRDNIGAVRGDTSEAGRGVCNLRSETNECNDAQGEDREAALCGPRPCNGQGSGDSLPSLQFRPGSISGQHRIVGESNRVSQDQLVIWCDLNEEQKSIESGLKKLGISFSSVYGSLSPDEAERRFYEWKNKKTAVLISKPSILGAGVNMQQAHKAIYAGVGFKFRDFIQSLHRLQRYGQKHTVEVHIIHTDAEDHVVNILMNKWKQHDEMVAKMRQIIKEFGLTNEALTVGMQRTLGVTRQEAKGTWFTSVNNDCVVETMTMPDNSIDEIVTSIPFGNHYEYVASLNDFGHNQADSDFWTQMDFLIPELLRVLKPGRMACIHVKDRLLYGHQTPHGMMEVDYFTHDCARAFRKHGFVAYGEIFIPTDVVRENNSTNRLGWSECCKDGSKMGVGLSEKVLLFRKPQTDKTRSYADEPVRKDKKEYSRGRWQVDAHSLWRSNGKALSPAEDPSLLLGMDGSQVYNWYRDWSKEQPYDYHQHVAFNEAMGDRLPAKFMLMPPQAPDEYEETVWTDVLFMRTLNMSQSRRRQEKHICPFALDVVERLIVRYSNPGELIYDPFGGLHTVPYMAIKLGRSGLGCELNELYWRNGLKYCQDAETERSTPSLFAATEETADAYEMEVAA